MRPNRGSSYNGACPANTFGSISGGLCPGAFAHHHQLAYSSYRWKDADGVVFSNLPTNDLGPGTYSVLVTDVQMRWAERHLP